MSLADASKSDEELAAMTKNWTIVGKDLLSVVSCKEPYEWKDSTADEWEFNEGAKAAAAGKKFKVRRRVGRTAGSWGHARLGAAAATGRAAAGDSNASVNMVCVAGLLFHAAAAGSAEVDASNVGVCRNP